MYAIGTAILIVGAIISYFQWRTAQQKVALDLFDSRYEIYEDLRKIVTEFMGNLEFNNELQRSYLYAQNRARFYFGAEVEDYLEMLRIDMMRGHYFDRFADRQAVNVNEQVARLDRIAAFYNEIDKMFIPYMRNDQRMPLWWWSNVSVSYERWIRAAKGWLARRRT
ncbi:MAG: hypothetical protein ABSA90_18520 [Xanthobacteraceae bacterium]|jgi:hypothetical protein